MKKHTLLPLLVLSALFTGAGKYKISKVGQPDVYVPTLDSDAKTLTVESVAGPGTVPIGGMVAVMPNIDVSNAWQPPASGAIKDGFMRADGTTIAASHRNAGCKLAVGTKLPNMVNSYPRGNTTSTNGTTGMGGANTQASNVTVAQQPTFYTPAHYHGFGAGSGLGGGHHAHAFWFRTPAGFSPSPQDANYMVLSSQSGQANQGVMFPAQNNTTDAQHGHTGTIGLVSGGSDGNSAIGNPRTADVTLTNNTVNNEPAYVETVWVIRVK
jgi:hypothetical protein